MYTGSLHALKYNSMCSNIILNELLEPFKNNKYMDYMKKGDSHSVKHCLQPFQNQDGLI